MNAKKIVSAIFVTFIFAFLFANIYKNWTEIQSYRWQFNLQNIFFLLAFLAPVYLINGMSWHLVNKSLGSKLTFFKNLKVLMLGNFGRFIPGGIWQYAGRIYLAKKEGINSSQTTVAIFTETLFTLILGIVIILTVGFFGKLPIQNKSLIWVFMVTAFLGLVTVILSKNKKFVFRLPLRWIPILAFSFLMQFITAGTVLYFLNLNVISLSLELYPLFIGIFAMSWLFGFITIFAPSGLGVQEITMAALLSNYMPFTVASVMAISFRLLLLAVEALTILMILIKQKN